MFDWITHLIERGGYAGVAVLMLLENVFPPIPSELVMPLAGFQAANGQLSVVGVMAAGTVGSLAGALFWYWIGCLFGANRLKTWAGKHGRWVTMTPGDVDLVDRWFDRHCGKAVLLGRMIPTLRTLISVPAGVFGMGLSRFLLFSTVGTAMWNAALVAAGYLLREQYARVSDYLNPVATIIVASMLGFYIYRAATWRP